jgi:hypothetical protein
MIKVRMQNAELGSWRLWSKLADTIVKDIETLRQQEYPGRCLNSMGILAERKLIHKMTV